MLGGFVDKNITYNSLLYPVLALSKSVLISLYNLIVGVGKGGVLWVGEELNIDERER